MRKIFFTTALCILSVFLNGQTRNIGLEKFLNKDKQIILPTTAGNFTEKLGFQPDTKDDPNTKRGFFFSWKIEDQVEVTFVELKDDNQYVGFSCFSDDEIGGLPYDFVFNKTSFDEAKERFKKLKPQWLQVAEEDNAYIKLSFQDKNRFVYLYFYGEEKVLRVVTVSTTELGD